MKRLVVLLLFVLTCVSFLVAQSAMRFERITVDHGLSQSSVNVVFKDSRGFLWIGTQDGLNRYDGYDFEIYKNRQGDSTSLSNNWVWSVFEDSSGRLWIGTFGGGLNLYDRVKNRFQRFSFSASGTHPAYSNSIRDIYEIKKGVLLLGSDHGYFRFLPDSASYTFFPPTGENFNHLRFAKRPGTGSVFLLTGNEVYQVSEYGRLETGLTNGALNTSLSSLYFSDKDNLLIGTSAEGLFHYNFTNQKLQPVSTVNSLLGSSASISDIWVDMKGIVWLGTEKGLVLVPTEMQGESEYSPYHLAVDRPRLLTHDQNDHSSLSHNDIHVVYASDDGVVWLGTRNGLNRFDYLRPRFAHIKQGPGGLSAQNVLPIIESRFGHIWIGTSSGLNMYDPRSGRLENFLSGGSGDILRGDYILSLAEDNEGRLWAGTRGAGIVRLQFNDPRKPHLGIKRADYYGAEATTAFKGKNVHSVYLDSQQRVWAGSIGLNMLSPGAERFKNFSHQPEDSTALSHIYIFDMLESSRGDFWIGTAGGGLNLMDRETNQFKRLVHVPGDSTSLVNDMILCVFEKSDGGLWIGTAGGLSRMVRRRDTSGTMRIRFNNYTERNGLPNNVVYGIVEDASSSLWISTNKGIAQLSFKGEKLQAKNFLVQDGLQSNEFNQAAYLRDSRGYIYFGGINGLTLFHPDSIKNNTFEPPVVLKNLYIRGSRLAAGHRHAETGFVLDTTLAAKKQLNLTYRENAFTLEFAALNFLRPEKNRHAYMLENFDDDWIETDQRRATYTNLDPGRYTFRVKGSNNDGVWSSREARLIIHVSPPPWRSWWAYTIYGLLLLVVLTAVVKLRERRITMRQEQRLRIERARAEERELVRRKSSADFHDEAGNLITKINLFTELARRQSGGDKNLSGYLLQIESHTRRLSSGMRDFIWVLDPGNDTLYDMLVRICDFGNSMCAAAEIIFKCDSVKNSFKDTAIAADDRRSFLMLFKEAINNAIKYAGAGCLYFTFKLEDDHLRLELRDDGKGFDVQKENKGYGLKNMRARAEKAAARFELNSAPGQGTTITVVKKITTIQHMGD